MTLKAVHSVVNTTSLPAGAIQLLLGDDCCCTSHISVAVHAAAFCNLL